MSEARRANVAMEVAVEYGVTVEALNRCSGVILAPPCKLLPTSTPARQALWDQKQQRVVEAYAEFTRRCVKAGLISGPKKKSKNEKAKAKSAD